MIKQNPEVCFRQPIDKYVYTSNDINNMIFGRNHNISLINYVNNYFSTHRFDKTYSKDEIKEGVNKWREVKKNELEGIKNIDEGLAEIESSIKLLLKSIDDYEYDEEADKKDLFKEMSYVKFVLKTLQEKLADDSIDKEFKDGFILDSSIKEKIGHRISTLVGYAIYREWMTRNRYILYIDNEPIFLINMSYSVYEISEENLYIEFKRTTDFSLNYKSNEYIIKGMPNNVSMKNDENDESADIKTAREAMMEMIENTGWMGYSNARILRKKKEHK